MKKIYSLLGFSLALISANAFAGYVTRCSGEAKGHHYDVTYDSETTTATVTLDYQENTPAPIPCTPGKPLGNGDADMRYRMATCGGQTEGAYSLEFWTGGIAGRTNVKVSKAESSGDEDIGELNCP